MARIDKVEIVGLKELLKTFDKMPAEVGPSVIRNIARKPAGKIISLARKLFRPKRTGATKRTFGILKVQNNKQTFLELGIKGRSLAWIFMMGAKDRKTKKGAKRGDIKAEGNVIQEAAGQSQEVLKEISIDISKTLAKAVKRYARR